ncbi:MAG: hypothetical protein J2O44_05035, partial [Porphyrobacter sp.]|nr:hypothetical protein [Porphyrobacter sp.]
MHQPRHVLQKNALNPGPFAGKVNEQVICLAGLAEAALGGCLMTSKSFGLVSSLALVTALASPAYAQDQAKTQGDA